jgi:hypothetical protein
MTKTATQNPETLVRGKPVSSFDMEFEWHSGQWEQLFDEQIELIRSDLERAKAGDKLVVYLSCPISGRGGGDSGANVDIALATQRHLLERWGESVWILNPANYQMESRMGTGLMNQHAKRLGIDLSALLAATGKPSGGDYMRMWTKLLVENGAQVGLAEVPEELKNSGQFFDAYYFLGPGDMHRFFVKGGESLTAGIESYFARRIESDAEFRTNYAVKPSTCGQQNWTQWEVQRQQFLRYYMFRAGATYSLGSHDEWNIWLMLNAKRRAARYGIAEQIAGFFEGRQLSCGEYESPTALGYQI